MRSIFTGMNSERLRQLLEQIEIADYDDPVPVRHGGHGHEPGWTGEVGLGTAEVEGTHHAGADRENRGLRSESPAESSLSEEAAELITSPLLAGYESERRTEIESEPMRTVSIWGVEIPVTAAGRPILPELSDEWEPELSYGPGIEQDLEIDHERRVDSS